MIVVWLFSGATEVATPQHEKNGKGRSVDSNYQENNLLEAFILTHKSQNKTFYFLSRPENDSFISGARSLT